MKINMGGGRSGLDALIDASNKVALLFFNRFEIMVEQRSQPDAVGALTKSSSDHAVGQGPPC